MGALCASSDAESVTPYEEFSYDFRQTKSALAMIVNVSNIQPLSVQCQFSHFGCDVSFTTDENTVNRYVMGFSTIGDLDIAKCSFDVANNYMVIVFAKLTSEYWIDPTTTDVATGKARQKSVLIKREYSPSSQSSECVRRKEGERKIEERGEASALNQAAIAGASDLTFKSSAFINELD